MSRLMHNMIAPLLATTVLLGTSPAMSTVMVDQTHVFFGGPKYGMDHDALGIQSFTVGKTGTLDHIDVFLFLGRPFPTYSIELSLQGLSGGVPDGIAQASATVTSAEIVASRITGTSNARVSFDISGAQIEVGVGDVFAFALETQGVPGDTGNWFVEMSNDPDTYPGGTVFNLGDPPVGNFSFETFVDVEESVAVSAPSVALIFAMFALVVIATKNRPSAGLGMPVSS